MIMSLNPALMTTVHFEQTLSLSVYVLAMIWLKKIFAGR